MQKLNKDIIAVFLIILLSVIVYANIFRNEFVFDDKKFVIDNLEIRKLSGIPQFFGEDFDGLYRPLRQSLYAINYQIWKLNPFGYHLNSLVLHILSSVLIYLILSLIAKKGPALIASVLFAVHPIHTERVTGITAGFDLLGIFFFLAAFYFYIKFSKSNKINLYIISILFFILALFSSEEAIILPLIVILYDTCFSLKDKDILKKLKERIKFYSSYFIIGILYIILRFYILGIRARAVSYPQENLFHPC